MEYKTLDELFIAWKNEHCEEDDSSCESSFPKSADRDIPDINTFKASFCADGFLCDGSADFNGILFILKESNVGGEAELNDTFWFKERLCKHLHGEDVNDSAWKKYYRNIEWYLKEKFSTEIDVSKCAYMNLNKRGGYGACNSKQLRSYVEKYNEFIRKQIEMINPSHIFCFGVSGVSVYELVSTLAEDIVDKDKVYKCRHLSSQSKKIYE